MSAAAVLTNGDGRYLIVKPSYKAGWNLPGGGVDRGETPDQACRRELREELGIDQEVGRLLVCACVGGADSEHIYWVFDGGALSARQQEQIVLQESELTDFRFSAPEAIGPEEIPAARRPLWDAALRALETGGTIYIGMPA
jgi:8-oxo-dGTP pyrophosphatase MutT (NUDIX family)